MRPYLCISYAKNQLEMDEWSECKPTPIKLLKEFIEYYLCNLELGTTSWKETKSTIHFYLYQKKILN